MSKPKKIVYSVNSIFGPTLQGEGHRAGTATMFLRFAGCNLQCVDGRELPQGLSGNEVDVGFFCDTDFRKGRRMTAEEIADELECGWLTAEGNPSVVITGGEPGLQLDSHLVGLLQERGWYVAVETNGTIKNLQVAGADWVSCSPKGDVVLRKADEVRCVVAHGQVPAVPASITARKGRPLHLFVSPAFYARSVRQVDMLGVLVPQLPEPGNLAWAIKWCLDNPEWRLSIQQHKLWGVQ